MIDLFIQLDEAGLLNQLIQAGYVTEKTRLYLDMYYMWANLSKFKNSTKYKVYIISSQFKIGERTVYNMLRWSESQYKQQSPAFQLQICLQ